MKPNDPLPALIGIFDSGVGGLSVLRQIREQLPNHPVIYFADQAHVPYGPRPLEEVRQFSISITRFLLEQGVRLVVVACNTASAAALKHLREIFPNIPFVGMEPAVKPAAEQTQSGVVGVLATPATFQGALYASVVERFARDVIILQDTCPGLVNQIEKGDLQSDETRAILTRALHPMLAQGADTIVMGCTHYPFVIPLIEEITQTYPTLHPVRVIDPAPAVARQVRRVLSANGLPTHIQSPASLRFITSGDPQTFKKLLHLLMGNVDVQVEQALWNHQTLLLKKS